MLAQGSCKDLVKRLAEQENLVAASLEFLHEDATLDLFSGLACVGHVEYLSLSFPLILHILGIIRITDRRIGYTTYLI